MIFALLKDVFYRDQFTATPGTSFDRDRYFLGLFLLLVFHMHNFLQWTALAYQDGHEIEPTPMLELLFYASKVLPNQYDFFFGMAVLMYLLVKRMFGAWLALPISALNLVAFFQISYVAAELLKGLTQTFQTTPISLISLVVCVLVNWYIWRTKPALKEKQSEHPLLQINNAVEHPYQMTAYWYLHKAVMSTLGLFVLTTLIYLLVGLTGTLTKAHSVQGIVYFTSPLFVMLLFPMMKMAPRRYANLPLSAQSWVKRGGLFWLISFSIILCCKWMIGFDSWYLSIYLLQQVSCLTFFIVVMIMLLSTPCSANQGAINAESPSVG